MLRLDKHKPYGHVAGLPGVVYQQEGHYFDGDGKVTVDPGAGGADKPEPDPEKELTDAPATDAGTYVAPPEPSPTSVAKDDMRRKENKLLKFQMEQHGEPWQGVDHAHKFLGVA